MRETEKSRVEEASFEQGLEGEFSLDIFYTWTPAIFLYLQLHQ